MFYNFRTCPLEYSLNQRICKDSRGKKTKKPICRCLQPMYTALVGIKEKNARCGESSFLVYFVYIYCVVLSDKYC